MTRPKPRRMRPTKAYVYVDRDTGRLPTRLDIGALKREMQENQWWRIARVRITEIPSKRK